MRRSLYTKQCKILLFYKNIIVIRVPDCLHLEIMLIRVTLSFVLYCKHFTNLTCFFFTKKKKKKKEKR